jgi:GTPase SAR1 family protein
VELALVIALLNMMINFYNFVPKQNNYLNRENALIKHPARILIVGASGSGKTNFLLNLLNHMNCFDKYYLYVKMLGNDPLYDDVLVPNILRCEEKHKTEILMAYKNDLDELPDLDEIDANRQNVFVFDDMIDEKSKDLCKIAAFFTKMRKKNCTLIFISQDYFKTPKIIRGNCDTIAITKIASNKDLQLVYQDINQGESFDEFREAITNATADGVFVKSGGKYLVNESWV